MADKLSMSLDEIIKANKTNKARAGGIRGKFPRKKAGGGGSVAAAAGGKNRLRGSSNIAARKIVRRSMNMNNTKRRSFGGGNGGGAAANIQLADLKKIVNKAVKQAVQGSNIASPTPSRIAGRLGGKVPRNIISSSRLAALNAQRNRGAMRNRNFQPRRMMAARAPAVQPVIIEEVAPAPQPVIIKRIAAPQPQVVEVVERIVQAPAGGRGGRFRRMGIQQGGQQQQIRRIGGGIVRPAQQRMFVQPMQQQQRQKVVRQQPQYVYEEDEMPQPMQRQRVQVVRQAPRQQVQVVRQVVARPQQQQQRFRGGNVQYVEYVQPQQQNAARRKNDAFRDALGLGGGGRPVYREAMQAPRFESFSAGRQIVRRGRGFM